ncbi:MAG: ABC transporter substrate binding protein, partial [Deltaproteobacteria bacterium]
MNSSRYIFVFLTLIAFLLSDANAALSSSPGPKRVLVLNSFNPGYSWTDKMLEGIGDTFEKSGLNIDTSVRFMDMKRIKRSEEYFRKLSELLESGYRNIRFDAVLACDNDALDFIRVYRDRLFPGVPVVFSSINDFDAKMLDGRNDITGTSENTDYLGTINVAVKLRPDAKNLLVVTDNTTTGQAHRSAIEKLRDKLPKNLGVQYISFGEMNIEDLGDRLSQLKQDTIVLLVQHFVDKNGVSHPLAKSTPVIASRSAVPVFVLTDSRVGFGPLGGHVVSGYHHGAAAADMAVKILKGRSIRDIPVMLDSPNKYIFDYRVMERFNISQKLLPADSIIINKPDTLADLYKKYLLSVILIAFAFSIIIAWMWREIRSRKNAEQALIDTQNRLHSFIANAPVILFALDKRGILTFSDGKGLETLGLKPGQVEGQSAFDLYKDSPSALEGIRRALAGEYFSIETVVGDKVFEVWYNPVKNGLGELTGSIGVATDITERKKAEESALEKELRYRTLFESANDGIFLQDATGFLDCNQRGADMYGLNRE